MLKLILNKKHPLLSFFATLKVDRFQKKDYQTMCSLIKQKFPVYNESIQINKDIKLLDQNNKLIGRYAASQARKKATTMKKDIVLVNQSSNPAICKVLNFRESILKKFLDQIVTKRNQQLIKKASTTRQLKISTNLSTNQIQIKAKQVIELARKNLNVRVYSICKPNHKDEGLALFDHLKSLLQNRCTIQKDIKYERYQLKEQQGFQIRKNQGDKQRVNISMVVKAKQNQFMNLLQQTSNKDPEQAIMLFLKRYYRQQDVDMKDLKQTENRLSDSIQDLGSKILQVSAFNQKNVKSKQMNKGEQKQKSQYQIQKQRQKMIKAASFVEQQAKARILNSRLKRILSLQNQ